MTLRERALYHQIHPVKLLTDWAAAALSAYALWEHRLGLGLLVGLLPPIFVSAVFLTGVVDLARDKESPLGHYVTRHMSAATQATRLFGVLPFWLGAWYHRWLWMVIGLLIVIAAWGHGAVKSE
jgi:hypothetical protein